MEYCLLGPTGVKVSKICLGTATFGVAPDAQEASNDPSLLSFLKERGRSSPDFVVRIDRSFLDLRRCVCAPG